MDTHCSVRACVIASVDSAEMGTNPLRITRSLTENNNSCLFCSIKRLLKKTLGMSRIDKTVRYCEFYLVMIAYGVLNLLSCSFSATSIN